MAAKKAKTKTTRQTGSTDIRHGGEDRSFGKVLQTKSTGKIIPEAVNRLEAGRRVYVQRTASVAKAELDLLVKEAKRLEEEKGDTARIQQVRDLKTAVESDLLLSQETLTAIKLGLSLEPDGLTVIGRVLFRDGSVPKKADVLFLTNEDEPVKEMGVKKLNADGWIRTTYAASKVKQLIKKRTQLVAAVRMGGRIVTKDEIPIRVAANQLYSFDLRVETGLGT